MKGIIAVIAVLIVGGLGWYFFMPQTPATTEQEGMMMEDHSMAGDEAMMKEESPMAEDVKSGSNSTGGVVVDAGVSATVGTTKTFNVTGHNFAFSDTEIRVKKGEKVTINFESTDGFHDWVVDEFNAATKQVQPGTKTSVTFTADKAGTFEYYCSVGRHRAMGMVGKLIVE